MRRSLSAIALVALVTLVAWSPNPALAQASPAPSAVPAATPAHLPEVGSVTVAAKDFYNRLVDANVDRSKVSADLNNALTPSVLTDLSERLGQLGSPLWQYVGGMPAADGNVYVYSLSYPTGTVLYFSFGMDAHGMVFTAFIGQSKPAGV
jgi:hypothetical protein